MKKGTRIKLRDGQTATILDDTYIGKGGQGTIYRVSYNNSDNYVLKWYSDNSNCLSEYFEHNLEKLIEKGREYPDAYTELRNYFTMPLVLSVRNSSTEEYGYIMDYINETMVDLHTIISGERTFPNVPLIAQSCMSVSEAFEKLQWFGMIYSDINAGAIFFDMNSGAVRICDCDNILEIGSESPDLCTEGYTAPEVVLGEKYTKEAGYYSLAVILFNIIMRANPLEGKGIKEITGDPIKRSEIIYGENPRFIMTDDTNPPIDEEYGPLNELWKFLSKTKIRENFEKTFGKGLKDPLARVDYSSWIGAFYTWKNSTAIIDRRFLQLANRNIVPKRQLLLFMVDISESMLGSKIDCVNVALNKTVLELKNNKRSLKNITLNVGILLFSNNAKWYEGGLFNLNDIGDINIEPHGNSTNFYKAFMELDSMMTDDHFINMDGHNRHSTIILVTDGVSTSKYSDELNELKRNIHFKNSERFAIGIDSEEEKADRKIMSAFVDSDSRIISSEDYSEIINAIVNASTTVVKKGPGIVPPYRK